jgi:diguanylate cyclase (GGDEF)-like protein
METHQGGFHLETDVQQPAATPDPGTLNPQIDQSFRQLPISLVVNLVNGLILVAVLWAAASAPVLLTWLLLLVAVTGTRFLTMRAFWKAAPDTRRDHAWTHYFVAGACASGIVWGAAGILLFHPSSFPHQVFLAFVLGGMVAGAVPLLSSVGKAYWLFAIPVLVPIGLQMLFIGDPMHLIMGLMIVIFGIAMLSTSAQVHHLYHDLENLRRELLLSIELSHSLEHMVRVDPLTQIPNKLLFEEELKKEWGRAERDNETLAVIIGDIDHFKEYNDHYGHPAGDRCLVTVAQTMQRALSRPSDVVARIGGEEFAFLLPRTSLSGAISVAELMREKILAMKLPHEASPVVKQVTLSFGVASSDDATVFSSADLVHVSDLALYEAKRRGRNQVAAIDLEEEEADTG